ncbi:MAG: hypothetical protein NUK65_04395 [Firmicutes bacterium]|nr:hypothetical protein [Bacillota bacterium]
MITIIIDHSYEDNYFMISEIEVNIADKEEKERIMEKFKQIAGALVMPDNELKQRIADTLEVDIDLIDLDTNEIDLD